MRRPPLRIVLINDYRRLLLRDPELPDVLLTAEWPGQKARLLCKELYRRLAPASERHLDRCLVLADGTIPPADRAFADLFPQDDPLAAMSLKAQAGGEFFWGFGLSTAAVPTGKALDPEFLSVNRSVCRPKVED